MSVSLEHVVHMAAQRAYHELDLLLSLLPRENSTSRKEKIMRYIYVTRTRFLRLLAVIKSTEMTGQAARCTEIIRHFESKGDLVTQAAGQIRAHHHKISTDGAMISMYPIPNAVDVLTSGSYSRIPTQIKEMAPTDAPGKEEATEALAWLNHELGTRLTEIQLPRSISSARIATGRLWLQEDHLYELSVTLSGPEPANPWRLLSVDIWVGGGGPDAAAGDGESREDDRLVAPDQIPMVHRMVQMQLDTGGAEPLLAACSALRGFCFAVRLMELTDDAQLLPSRWGNRIRVSSSPNQHLHITYWEAGAAGAGAEAPPTLKLALVEDTPPGAAKGPARETTLRATHDPELIDAETGKEVLFSAVHSSLDEMLALAMEHSARAKVTKVVACLKESGLYPAGLPDCVIDADERQCLTIRYTHPEKARFPRSSLDLVFRVVLDLPSGLFVFTCDALRDNGHWGPVLADCGARLSEDIESVTAVLEHLRWHLTAQQLQDASRELPLRLHQLAPISSADIATAREKGWAHLRFQLCDYPKYFLHLMLADDRSVEYRLHATDALEAACVLPTVRHTMQLRDLEGPFPPKKRRVGAAGEGAPLTAAGDDLAPAAMAVDGPAGGGAAAIGASLYDELLTVTSLSLERIPRIEVAQQLQAHDVKHTFSLSSSSGTFLALPPVAGAPSLAGLVAANMFSVDDDGVRVQLELSPEFPAELVGATAEAQLQFDPETRAVTLPKLACTRFADEFLAFWRGASVLFELAKVLGASGRGTEGLPADVPVAVAYRFSSLLVGVGELPPVTLGHGASGLTLDLSETSPLALVRGQLCANFTDLNRPLLALHRGTRGLAALAAALESSGGACSFDAWSSTAGDLRFVETAAPALSISFFTVDTVVVGGDRFARLHEFFKTVGAGGVCRTTSGSVAVPIADFEAGCASGSSGEPAAIVQYLAAARVRCRAAALVASASAGLPAELGSAQGPVDDGALRITLRNTTSTFSIATAQNLVKVEANLETAAVTSGGVATLLALFSQAVLPELRWGSAALHAFLHLVAAPAELLRELTALAEATIAGGSPQLRLLLVAPSTLDPELKCPAGGPGVRVEYGGGIKVKVAIRLSRSDGETDLVLTFNLDKREVEWGWESPSPAPGPVFEQLKAAFATSGSISHSLKTLLQ